MKERDLSLDFFRGIAAISVIFIHTVYWSGSSYVPEIFRTLALLIDVPFFIFLSGWSMNYSSKLTRIFTNLLKIWFHWILFITLIDLFCLFAFKNHITKIAWLKQVFFAVEDSVPKFPVINGSLWFMPMYIMVSICGGIFVNFWNRFNLQRKYILYVVAFLLIGLTYISIGLGNSWFFLSRTVCFYLSAFLIGWYAPQIKIKKIIYYVVILFGIIFLWFLISRFFYIPAKNLQSAKFPCHIMYFVASLLSFFTSIFLRDRMNFKWNSKLINSIQGGGKLYWKKCHLFLLCTRGWFICYISFHKVFGSLRLEIHSYSLFWFECYNNNFNCSFFDSYFQICGHWNQKNKLAIS